MDPRRYSQGNLPKQIWGRKDRGLRRDAGTEKEEILTAGRSAAIGPCVARGALF